MPAYIEQALELDNEITAKSGATSLQDDLSAEEDGEEDGGVEAEVTQSSEDKEVKPAPVKVVARHDKPYFLWHPVNNRSEQPLWAWLPRLQNHWIQLHRVPEMMPGHYTSTKHKS
ncbi:hypothetical protein K439DRAFT_1620022 [Ramaria rubella]|nr:hypothetical protein K439DRAFT_1620022 [Ramaria rubella]